MWYLLCYLGKNRCLLMSYFWAHDFQQNIAIRDKTNLQYDITAKKVSLKNLSVLLLYILSVLSYKMDPESTDIMASKLFGHNTASIHNIVFNAACSLWFYLTHLVLSNPVWNLFLCIPFVSTEQQQSCLQETYLKHSSILFLYFLTDCDDYYDFHVFILQELCSWCFNMWDFENFNFCMYPVE